MTSPQKILLATDGSDTAQAATDFLMGLPLPAQAEVTVMTVLKALLREEEMTALDAEQRGLYQQISNESTNEAQQLLDMEAKRLQASGINTRTLVRTGHPAEQILREAGDGNYDIIVVGSHGMHARKRFLLGGTSDRVFEYAPCSVLIVKPASDEAVSDKHLRIFLAYDDSPPARAAVELLAALPLPENTRLKAVTALPLIKMFRQDVRQQLNWLWKQKKTLAQQALERLKNEVEWKHVDVSTEVIESNDVASVLLEKAAAFDSDLMVIGNKSKTTFERFLLGSVTAQVTHHAPCSVLAVRQSETDRA